MIFSALVIVHGDTLGRSPLERVHELAGPVRVVSVWAAGDQERLRVAVLPQINRKPPVMICINFRAHPSAAAPGFVAHAPVAHAKRLGRSVFDALFGKRTSRRHVAVLDPVAHFLGSAAPHVAGKIRLRANQPAQRDEFVRAEAAVFDVATPVNIDALWPALERSNSVAPVIVVRKTTTGPAQNRYAEFF